jgi:hypothetical protein
MRIAGQCRAALGRAVAKLACTHEQAAPAVAKAARAVVPDGQQLVRAKDLESEQVAELRDRRAALRGAGGVAAEQPERSDAEAR